MSECVELKNIMYRSGHTSKARKTQQQSLLPESKSESDLANIERVLEDEKNVNKAEAWSRLDKTVKTRKLVEYATTYSQNHQLDAGETAAMITFFRDCLDRKRLFRVKDVIYDKTAGVILDVPALQFNRTARHFTLRVTEKRVSTLKSLPKKPTTIPAEADSGKSEI